MGATLLLNKKKFYFYFFFQTPFAPISLFSAARLVRVVRFDRKSFYAGVSSDRTNLSPFTKDYRGLALPCDFTIFEALSGTTFKNK